MDLNYDDALALLREHNKNESLVRHGIAVGAATAAYARKYGEDENKWRIAGLLHDVDYEEHPTIEEHGKVGARMAARAGLSRRCRLCREAHTTIPLACRAPTPSRARSSPATSWPG